MYQIFRQSPNDTQVLILFFTVGVIFIFQYLSDPRRFIYYYTSLYTKQYHINYSRSSKLNNVFMILFCIQSLLMVSFLLAEYLLYCSTYAFHDYKFLTAITIVISYFGLKWLALFIVSILFDKSSFFQEFMTQSAHFINLFFAPIILFTIYFYLNGIWSVDTISNILLSVIVLGFLSKIKLYLHLKKQMSLGLYYIILYICTFELAPFLWLLMSIKC